MIDPQYSYLLLGLKGFLEWKALPSVISGAPLRELPSGQEGTAVGGALAPRP